MQHICCALCFAHGGARMLGQVAEAGRSNCALCGAAADLSLVAHCLALPFSRLQEPSPRTMGQISTWMWTQPLQRSSQPSPTASATRTRAGKVPIA